MATSRTLTRPTTSPVSLVTGQRSIFAARLRAGSPSVFCRTEAEHVLFDLRTVGDEELHDLARAILYALEGDDRSED